MKPYHAPIEGSTLDMEALDDIFLGQKLPVPDITRSVAEVRVGNLVVDNIENHKRGAGKPSPLNYQYYFTFRGYPANQGAWCHVNIVPQCAELIGAYRKRVLEKDPQAFTAPSSGRRSSL